MVVFGPPLNNSGGVGTLFTYFKNQVEERIDLRFVDTRGSSSPLFSIFNLVAAAYLATKLRFQRKIDVAHLNMGSRGSTLRKLTLTLWLKKILRIPTALHLHASSFDTWMEGLQPFIRKLVIRGINLSDTVFVLGEVWKKKLVDFGVDDQRIQIIVMGVPDLCGHIAPKDSSSGLIRILFAGEMSERKGLPNLLDAMSDSRLDKFRLSVAGAGSIEQWQKFVKTKAAEQRIEFVGHVSVAEVHKLLAQSDILILPSVAEGLPVSVMEGFASKTAVICTAVGALEHYLRHLNNSYVLTSNSSVNIMEALVEVKNEHLRNQMAKNGHQTWSDVFDVNKTSEEIIKAWRIIANSKNATQNPPTSESR